ncbi:FeoB-associated Cys-rich membrane protein [Peptoniphilus equinus]|uniref:FeoB-associated Cys-rich membrane protein n=1 Tax=Peptoniphilus equinus TaxID=3016343 RepID=A0ABY7QUH1_9FIRM|nr:FeoB-associated Cys-rich membrane protein [Peptoniphilus equinus]WBW49823.1 FeoB-associated Cys-rich membrane protein [Peptoniphilus equinus]
MGTLIVGAVVVIALGLALRHLMKHKSTCNCGECSGHCHMHEQH